MPAAQLAPVPPDEAQARRHLPVLRRPRTRGECRDGPRPCPFVSCRHHLKFDIHPERGTLIDNAPGVEVWEMRETCSLDVAERNPWDRPRDARKGYDGPGGVTLQQIGDLLGITLEGGRKVFTLAQRELVAKLLAAPTPED